MTLFFYGPNTYAMSRQVDEMAAAYIRKNGSDIGIERLDGATVSPAQLRAALQASPFLASSRLVIVRGLSLGKATSEKIGDVLALVPTSTVAVFVEPTIDKRTALYARLTAADKVMAFEPLSPARLTTWVKQQFLAAGVAADPAAITELTRRVGDDQWSLSTEIAKLVSRGETVTRDRVVDVVAFSPEATIFELVEAVSQGQTQRALAAYIILSSARQDDIYIITMLEWQLRSLLFIVCAPAGMPQAVLAKAAALSPYVVGKLMPLRRQFSEETLITAFSDTVECEAELKSGGDPLGVAVEVLIHHLSALVRRDNSRN